MKYFQNKRGSVAVMFALTSIVLLGFAGLVIDIGSIYAEKAKMQHAADAAACAGALRIKNGTADSSDIAKVFVSKNGYNPDSVNINYDVDTKNNPSNSPEINISITRDVPTYFMKLFGFSTVPVTVLAEAIWTTSHAGTVWDFAIYSKTGQVTLASGTTYYGSIFSGGSIKFQGGSTTVTKDIITSGAISGYNYQGYNNNYVNGNVYPNGTYTGTIVMPTYSASDFSITSTYTAPDNGWRTVTFSENTYVNGSLPSGVLKIGEGVTVIMASGDINLNIANVTFPSNQLLIYSQTGNINIIGGESDASVSKNVILYAPKGTVSTGGGNCKFHSAIANYVNNYGGALPIGTDNLPITIIPGKGHARLIK